MSKIVGTYRRADGSLITVREDDYKEALEMTEEEVHEAALSDPDAQPLTEEQMKKFKRVSNPRPTKRKLDNG